MFEGGVVCYANELKTELLGVDPALIEADGAVSESVARAMAVGAVRALGVDLAVAVTGIAGPGGGTEAKPVGTVWLGAGRPERGRGAPGADPRRPAQRARAGGAGGAAMLDRHLLER